MRGGSLYISLSIGWFSIKCHLLIKIFLRLGTDGLSICKFDLCEDFVYQIIWIASDTQV